jgi:hypothetical protein
MTLTASRVSMRGRGTGVLATSNLISFVSCRSRLNQYTNTTGTRRIRNRANDFPTPHCSANCFHNPRTNLSVSSPSSPYPFLFSSSATPLLNPLSLAGFLGPIVSPQFFISSQLPSPYPLAADATSILLAQQLGNAYLLLGLLGLFILNTTTELKVVRAYLWALWLGDIGHVGLTLFAMGWEGTMDVGKWNAVIWGNIGATGALFLMRSLYFAGAFGNVIQKGKAKAKRR